MKLKSNWVNSYRLCKLTAFVLLAQVRKLNPSGLGEHLEGLTRRPLAVKARKALIFMDLECCIRVLNSLQYRNRKWKLYKADNEMFAFGEKDGLITIVFPAFELRVIARGLVDYMVTLMVNGIYDKVRNTSDSET